MQKDIIIVTSRLNIGGVAKSSCMLANNLSKQGYNVGILRFSSEPSKFYLDERITVYTILGPDIIASKKNSLLKKAISIIFNFKVFIFLLTHKNFLYIAFRTDIVLLLVRYKKIIKYKLIGSERGNPYRFNPVEHEKVLKEYKKCDSVVFQTERGRECFSELCDNTFVIPNYCDIKKLAEIDINDRNKDIVACGVPGEDKGFDILIEAFAKVCDTYNDYRLIIYGPINDYCIGLKQLVLELAISGRVLFKGESKHFFIDANHAAMYVLSSRNEGIPNTLIEAMNAGIPCIATDCTSGGPALLLDNGKYGRLVPVENPDKLADAIMYYIENKELVETMARLGKDGLRRFSADKVTNKWKNLIEKI